MIELVEEHVIVARDEGSDRADARLIACREHERRLLAEEAGEPIFELVVQVQCAVQETTAGRAAPI